VGDDVQTTVVVLLGEGPWDGVESLYWGGDLISPTSYHFHSGELSTSMDVATQLGDGSWTQGVDPWNQGGLTYSGTAYIIVKLPLGVTADDDFSKLKGVYRCLKVQDYDEDGVALGKSYSVNPARVWTDLVIERRGLSTSRINWPSWVDWRDFNDVDIDWTGGTVAGRPTWHNLVNALGGADGSIIKTSGTEAWDSGATTVQSLPVGVDGFIEFDADEADVQVGLTYSTTISSENDLDYGVRLGQTAGNFSIISNNVMHNNLGSFVAGDRFRIAIENGFPVFYQNGVILAVSPTPVTPSGTLYGGFLGMGSGDQILRSTFNPMGSAARTRERFEAGLAFTSNTDISIALEAVLTVSCANVQEVNGKFSFLPPVTDSTPRTPIFSFDMSKIVEDSFSANRLSRESKPTRMIGKFRNSDDQYLTEDSVVVNRDILAGIIGRVNDLGEVPLGTMTRGQADVVTNYQMRMLSDLDLYCSLTGDGRSYRVAPGDLVSVSHDVTGWADIDFLVIETTDEASTESADTRKFKLQIFNINTYQETDQTALISNVPTTTPSSLIGPPAASLDLDFTQTYLPNNLYVLTINGEITFAPYNATQIGRVYVKKPGALDYVITDIVRTPDSANKETFDYIAPEGGTYFFKVVTENAYHVVDTTLTHAEDSIDVVPIILKPPMPEDLLLRRIVNDLVITWDMGTLAEFQLAEPIEQYIIRIRDASTNALIRQHTIKLDDAIPCQWERWIGFGDEALVHTSSTGSIWNTAPDSISGYRSQVFEGDASLEVQVDDRPFYSIGLGNSPYDTSEAAIYRYYPAESNYTVDTEDNVEKVRRLMPNSTLRVDVRNGQAEFFVNGAFWARSSRPKMSSPIRAYMSFVNGLHATGDPAEPQALLHCRVRPHAPRQFVYTENMQMEDFLTPPATVVVEVVQIAASGEESDPATDEG
jgi:hypothetical protein